MRSLIPALALLVALGPAGGARAASTHAIAQEVVRNTQLEKRVVSVWWLPVEYWEAAARDLGWKPDRIAEMRERLRLYAVIAVVDATVTADKRFQFAEVPAIADELTLHLGGEPITPVRKLDPDVMRPMPELSYLLRASLAGLSQGLRLMFFPAVDSAGKPLAQAGSAGAVRLRYAIPGKEALEFHWRTPLTAVAGARRDRKTGEPLEASWRFNPWTGEKLQ